MQNYSGQFLFQFPENISVDMDQLYAKVIAYFNANNQDALLSSQIQSLTTTFGNNKTSSDQQFTTVNTNITNLQNSQNNYLLIKPINQTKLNSNYNITQAQISDLKSYLLTTSSSNTALNTNYTITLAQITDFTNKINNYLLITPTATTALNSNYTIKQAQISDLKSYLLTTPSSSTNLNSNYKITSAQITDLATQLGNYLLITPTATTTLNTNYTIKQSQISDLANYLLTAPSSSITLNSNYKITSAQITDLATKLGNYLLITPTATIDLNSKYTITQAQISDLKSYLLTTPLTTTALNALYTIKQSQISDLSSYLLTTPSATTALNTKYTITQAQIPDLASYLLSAPSASVNLNSNYKITSAQITDLITQLGNYLLKAPTVTTALSTNYTIKQSQIVDLGPADMSKYVLIAPSSSTYLNQNYLIQNQNLIDNSIAGSRLQPKTITYDKIADQNVLTQTIQDYAVTQQKIGNQQVVQRILCNEIRRAYVWGNYINTHDMGTFQTRQRPGYDFPCAQLYLNQYVTFGQYQSDSSVNFAVCSTMNQDKYLTVNNWDLATQYVDDPSITYVQFSNSRIMRLSDKSGAFSSLHCSTDKGYAIFDGFIADAKITVGGAQYIQFFTNCNNSSSFNVFINSNGQYIQLCDQNVKDNIQPKTNYQDQLNKLLKLNIVTYSYVKQYDDSIQERKEKLKDESLTQEQRDKINEEIFQMQTISSKTIQNYTYQDLEECGFYYTLLDYQIMNDSYLNQKGIDKDKVKEAIKSNPFKAVDHSAMTLYVICGIKALKENITNQDTKILDQQNQIEKINERIDLINNAMIQSLSKIDEVSQQTDQKIQEVQNNSLIHSINSDNIDDIKNTLNKLINNFDTQQQTIKKLQTSNVFLSSQLEQLQNTIDKQNQDIINLKLKAKLV